MVTWVKILGSVKVRGYKSRFIKFITISLIPFIMYYILNLKKFIKNITWTQRYNNAYNHEHKVKAWIQWTKHAI